MAELLISDLKDNLKDLKQLMPPQQVIDRMKCKYANFPIMSDKEYQYLIYETQITDSEFNVIHAMQSSIALDILEGKLTNQYFLRLKESYRWVESYKPNFKGYDEARQHLEKVNRYHMHKYKQHCNQWWIDSNYENPVALLDWSEVMVDRAIKKYGERTKPKRRSSVLAEFE